MVAAAGALQRVARGWAARRAVRKVLEAQRRKCAAATVQRSLGRHVAAQKIRRRRLAAALTICNAVGILSAKLLRLRLRRDTAAATAIQSAYRGYRSRMVTGARLAGLNEAAIKIQSLFRSQHQQERMSFILRRTRRRDEEMANEQVLPKLKPTRGRPCLGAVTPAVGSEGPGHPTSSAKIDETTGERQVARAPVTQVDLSSGRGDGIGGKHDGGVDNSLPPTSLIESKLRVTELRETAVEIDKHAASVTTGEDRVARRRCREREALQSAVQAVARGMARHGTVTPDDARGLKQMLSLGESDPALEAALQRQLSRLQLATVPSKPSDTSRAQGLDLKYTVIGAARGLGGGDEDTLRRALSVLERRLSLPLE